MGQIGQNEPFSVVQEAGQHEHVSLVVRWDWTSDTDGYWLTHTSASRSGAVTLSHASNRFSWKPVDAVGDAGLVVRWIREARTHLILPS